MGCSCPLAPSSWLLAAAGAGENQEALGYGARSHGEGAWVLNDRVEQSPAHARLHWAAV